MRLVYVSSALIALNVTACSGVNRHMTEKHWLEVWGFRRNPFDTNPIKIDEIDMYVGRKNVKTECFSIILDSITL